MPITRISLKERMIRFFYFFPFQLVILHFKKNHLLLVFWIILLGYISGNFGAKYGVPILFLYPEYLGFNNYIAFIILGFATGGFIMAFNLYSYIMHGFRFPFIASIARPFVKFSLNNFIIPVVFICFYCYYSIDYQLNKELVAPKDIAINLAAYVGGVVLFCLISFAYFLTTNKDVFRFLKAKKGLSEGFGLLKTSSANKESQRWENIRLNQRTWRVETYMQSPFRIGLARDSIHYKTDIIAKILSQNHINASIFELLLIISFLVIGSLREFDFFMIPAAASLFLLFTMMLMIISAMFSWFKGWTISVLVILFLIVNGASSTTSFLNKESRAYGINYETQTANYSQYLTSGFPDAKERLEAKKATISILNNWKNNVRKKYGIRKPKLIILNSSGGGLRSALWNFKLLTYLDSVSNGRFYDHVGLITGSSGGMIGQAVFRELKLRAALGNDSISYHKYYEELGKDILNPIAFSLVTNDLFIRYQQLTDNGYTYTKDRGYAFEKALNENSNFVLDKRLVDYKKPEEEAIIPMMIISPAIVNDARKLLIASTPISYLTTNPNKSNRPLAENIDYAHFLKQHQPLDLKVTTALRMSSNFPFILPSITLPTVPKLDVMDAGFRDNYGLTTSIAFASELEDWIAANTSGVLFVQIRDVQKYGTVSANINSTFLKKLVSPIETVYGNMFNIHNYTQDQIWEEFVSGSSMNISTSIITLQKNRKDKISLSWHLSRLEKAYISNGVSDAKSHPEIDDILMQIRN